ncbi:MAG: zinc metallopeptidase [Clostridiaceae bacterium]|nr:zinc metallopeptidase [Clostridiaceae bacterium]
MLINLVGFGQTAGLYYGLDIWYLVLIIPALLLSLLAQAGVKGTFNKYSRIMARSGNTGQSAARRILNQSGLSFVTVEKTPGQLTDHYDPRTQVLRLSESTCDSPSIAAIGVAAHEAGHAIQHDEGYLPNKIRGALVPVAQIGSAFGPYLAFFGIFLSIPVLINAGILLFAGAVLFYLITLPVEFNASRRAIRILEDQNLLTDEELGGARKVLRAAAMTYVASAIMSFASLLRLILLSRGRDDRRR